MLVLLLLDELLVLSEDRADRSCLSISFAVLEAICEEELLPGGAGGWLSANCCSVMLSEPFEIFENMSVACCSLT